MKCQYLARNSMEADRNKRRRTSDKRGGLKVAIVTSYQAFNGGIKGHAEMTRRFSDTLGTSYNNLYIIGGFTLVDGKNMHVETGERNASIFISALKYIPNGELGTFIRLAQILGKVDIVVFFLSAPLILPLLLAKIARKKTVFVLAGLESKEIKLKLNNRLAKCVFPKTYEVIEKICLGLVDRVAVESDSVLHFHGMDKYSPKAMVFGASYIDTSIFKAETLLGDRKDVIGYVGRLSLEKGIMEFIQAIPIVLDSYNNVKFLIVGDGPLKNDVECEIKKRRVEDRVTLAGWVPRNDIPHYLNQIKLLVSPSYTEGLPPLIQEAMSCGTPVLATPVGGIPDLITDAETGFILESNSPESIAQNILRVLHHQDLERIVKNAQELIQREYTYEVTVEKYTTTLNKLVGVKSSARD